MRYGRVTGGHVLRRRSFRVLSLGALVFYFGGATVALIDGLTGNKDGMIAAALILTVGSLSYRVTRSRVHVGETSLTVVNPLFAYEVPYGAVQRIGLSLSGSLMVLPKESAADTDGEGYLVVGFAGSLLDRIFRTSEKAAAKLKKLHKKGRRRPGADGPVRRMLVADAVADGMLLVAAGCAVASLALG
ncbi:hypothetical protein AB0E67_35655 [Streptomyces sp. NPDC032161]|uniref:hypothetical protein n=1 Tax=unclassified Streptomyces TaxID=2593676 RepID=UPI0033C39C5A